MLLYICSMKMSVLLIPVLAVCLAGCTKVGSASSGPDAPGSDPSGPGGTGGSPAPGEYVLPLVETTDIHGHIVGGLGSGGSGSGSNNSGSNASTIEYSLAYIADKVNDMRGGDRSRVLLLDGGDIYQGASISNLLDGKPVYVALDRMGYDAVTVGNHEFDWDITTLIDPDATLPDYEWEGRTCVSEVPVVCANIYQDGSRFSRTDDYVIVEKTASNASGQTVKVKIGVIGFAIDYSGSIMASKFRGKGFSVQEDYSIANGIAAELEGSGQCDATVLLIHGKAETAAENLGRGSAVDLVLGGHSHQTMAGKAASGVAYVQGGRHCEHYACSELVFDVDGAGKISFKRVGNQRIADVDGDLSGRDADNFDKDIVAVCDEALAAIGQQMNDVVGYITIGATTFDLDGSGGRASVMGNWMCDILRGIGEADVSFLNSGGIRTYFPLSGHQRRDITVSDIYEMFPFGNKTYVYSITYDELLQVFKYSLTSSGSSLFSCMTGIDCHYSGQSVVALEKDGLTIYSDGRWEGDWASRSVILAASEYLATGERTDYRTGLSNPLPAWNSTSKLLNNSLTDNENAVRVLRAEASASGGHLYLDTRPHFLAR